MLSIGPYVVVREISTQTPGTPGDGAGKTYRATDRLTGIPVLLHNLPTMTGVPELPRHPALLPFTDIVVHAGEAFLVTELPPNAVPAREPVQAARGALMALTALHERGLAHGGMNAAQLWSVDGPVRLAGGGRFDLNREYTVARDLQDLAVTLDELGGLPPILSLLRTEPERLSAREALELLQTGELPAEPRAGTGVSESRGVRFQGADLSHVTRQGGLPNLDPLSLLNPSAPLPQTPSFVSQAVWTTTQEPSSSNTDPGIPAPVQSLPFKLDISQWDVPDFMEADAAVTPVPTLNAPEQQGEPTRTVSLGWQDVNRPLQQRPVPEVTTTPDTTPPPPEENSVTRQGRKARAAANQALQRLRADGERQRQLQEVRRDEVVAQLAGGSAFPGVEPAHQLAALASGEESLPTPENETPQERRRREHQARLEAEQLAGQLAETRPLPAAPPVTPASTPQDDSVPLPARQLKGVKMRWDDRTKTWQKVPDTSTPTPSTRPAWLIPALAAAALLVLLLVWAVARRPAATNATTPEATSAVSSSSVNTCCTVDFRVTGGTGKASISIVNTTSKNPWKPGQVIGQVPGTLQLPGEGAYKLGVTSEGFSPATLDVTLPTTDPVTINLGQ